MSDDNGALKEHQQVHVRRGPFLFDLGTPIIAVGLDYQMPNYRHAEYFSFLFGDKKIEYADCLKITYSQISPELIPNAVLIDEVFQMAINKLHCHVLEFEREKGERVHAGDITLHAAELSQLAYHMLASHSLDLARDLSFASSIVDLRALFGHIRGRCRNARIDTEPIWCTPRT